MVIKGALGKWFLLVLAFSFTERMTLSKLLNPIAHTPAFLADLPGEFVKHTFLVHSALLNRNFLEWRIENLLFNKLSIRVLYLY